ncbi:hypothetical protein Plhal304r1_c032g0102121 [Plasmopara halstedii]
MPTWLAKFWTYMLVLDGSAALKMRGDPVKLSELCNAEAQVTNQTQERCVESHGFLDRAHKCERGKDVRRAECFVKTIHHDFDSSKVIW